MPIAKMGTRPTSARASTTTARIFLNSRARGCTLSTQIPSVTGVRGPVSAKEAIFLPLASHVVQIANVNIADSDDDDQYDIGQGAGAARLPLPRKSLAVEVDGDHVGLCARSAAGHAHHQVE